MNNDDKTQTQRSLREKTAFLSKVAQAAETGLTKKSNKTLKELALWPHQADPQNQTMSPFEAEEIINMFWNSFKDLSAINEIVQPVSDLPFSPGRIKYAHFTYTEGLIMNFLFNKEIGDRLTESYVDINTRFVENSEELNLAWRQYRDNLDNGVISKNPLTDLADAAVVDGIEFNNFIAEFNKLMQK